MDAIKFLIFLLIFPVFILLSCKKLLQDDELTLKRRDYAGNELRLDGYYFTQGFDTTTIGRTCFFYRNGVVLDLGGWPYSNDFEGFENNILTFGKSENKIGWGVFQVDSTQIQFDSWYPSSGGGRPTALKLGIILNDSTFHMTSSTKTNGETKQIDETYHFRQFSPKPDSTNNYIE